MKIAIISDTHDQLERMVNVCQKIKDLNCEVILHCGDWCSPFTVQEFLKCGLPIYGVLGNNDGDRDKFNEIAKQSNGQLKIDPEVMEIELDNKKIAFNHYPERGLKIYLKGQNDLVAYGHNHTHFLKKEDDQWLVNPGCLIRSQTGIYSFAVYDTPADTVELIEVA